MISDKVNRIHVNTGNLITCKELNRRATQSPAEEVAEILQCTLHSWVQKPDTESVNDSNSFKCINSNYVTKVDKEDRVNLKLTVKVFVDKLNKEDLTEAVDKVMEQLDVTVVDSVILALPNIPSATLTVEHIKPLWQALEEFVLIGKVVTIGASDLDTGQLTELYNWAQVKPSVNQVNLESCCVMPPEMTAFAKEHDIQLLTHNDPKFSDLISEDTLKTLFKPIVPNPASWKASWIVRYSIVVKCRGIIQSKGYLLCTEKKSVY